MLKNLMVIIIISVLILLVYQSMYCIDETHKGNFPVNPYCKKCRERDGIVQHKCSNVNGMEKYCATCGKRVVN